MRLKQLPSRSHFVPIGVLFELPVFFVCRGSGSEGILGNGYSVRGDAVSTIIGIMVLTAFAGASLGLTIGTLVKPEQIGLMFSLIFTPLIFTGCTYYPWGTLGSIRWFQIVTLFNPMTYASEGLRFAMVPAIQGHTIPTLAMGWVILGLSVTFVAFLIIGIRTFRRRVVS